MALMEPLERKMPKRPQTRLRVGTVVSVGTGVCTVIVGNTTLTNVPYVNQPVEGDTVYVLQDGASMLVLGTSAVPPNPSNTIDVAAAGTFGFYGEGTIAPDVFPNPVTHYATASLAFAGASSAAASKTTPGGDPDYVDPSSTTIPDPMVAWPTAANTGTLGETLTTRNTSYTTQADNEVVSHLHFTGGARLTIAHKNVKVKFCQIDGGWSYVSGGGAGGIVCQSTTNAATLQIWNCTVGSNTKSPGCGIRAAGGKIRRVNVMNVTDGLWLYEGNVELRDSYVHDLHHWASDPSQGGGDSHNDSIQIKGGSNWHILHNRFECWRVEDGQNIGARNPSGKQTSGLGFYATTSACTGAYFDSNIFRGDTNVYISCVGDPALLGSGTGGTRPPFYNVYITNNILATGDGCPQADWFHTSTVKGEKVISGNTVYAGQ